MYIIIVGGGKVGYYLSQALLSEGHEVLILEKDAARCGAICEQLGSVVVRRWLRGANPGRCGNGAGGLVHCRD